jgi:Protein of unknown function (DUF3592)
MKLSVIVFTVICLGALGLGSYEASRHLGREWKAVPAQFIKYETLYRIKTKRAAYPAIHYSYQVDGKTYFSEDTSLTGKRYRDGTTAKEAALAIYDIKNLVAYYDVSAPEISNLNPVDSATAWSYVYVPVLIMLGGWGLAYISPKLKLNELLSNKK